MDYTNGKDVTYDRKYANKNTLMHRTYWRYIIWRKWDAIGQSEGQNGRPGMQWEDVRGHEPDLKSYPSVSFDVTGPREGFAHAH
jgi:hypothetical protein